MTPDREHRVLNSWKEIAAYMRRGVRTVQRWERALRLPIHRPANKVRSAVIAFSDEIDQWLNATPKEVLAKEEMLHKLRNREEWERLVKNSQIFVEQASRLKRSLEETQRLIESRNQQEKKK